VKILNFLFIKTKWKKIIKNAKRGMVFFSSARGENELSMILQIKEIGKVCSVVAAVLE
jgi:hypothetical protein